MEIERVGSQNGSMTYRTSDQYGTSPVAAELGVGHVGELPCLRGHGAHHRLPRARKMSTSSTAGDALSESLLGGGNRESRGREKHLSEESETEHNGRQRSRGGDVGSSGLSSRRTGWIPSWSRQAAFLEHLYLPEDCSSRPSLVPDTPRPPCMSKHASRAVD